ncbi:MAG: DUF4364 family protein [Clostridia bacterium]
MIHDESTNNKLLILFVLDKLEMPISEELLLQICSIDNIWIPYLYCKDVIRALLASGFITKPETEGDTRLIALTTDGRTCLAHFYNDIPASVREDVAEFVKEQRLSYRKRQEFQADYSKNTDGTYTVNLKILEVAQPLMDLKFVVVNRAMALSVANAWNEKAPEAYRAIHEILIDY